MSSYTGWGLPINAHKSHYFIEGRSLCEKWLLFGKTVDGPSKCKICQSKLVNLKVYK